VYFTCSWLPSVRAVKGVGLRLEACRSVNCAEASESMAAARASLISRLLSCAAVYVRAWRRAAAILRNK